MNCFLDNPMCDGTSCVECKLVIVTKERDEARSIARQTLSAQLEGKVAVWNLIQYPWLKEQS